MTNLPPFVDRVPLIYLQRENEVLVDDAIDDYIDQFKKPKNSNSPSTDTPEDVLPFALMQNTNYSENFSFLNDASDNMPNSKAFSVLRFDERPIAMPSSGNSSDDDTKKSKFNAKMLEEYMQSRDHDTASFKQSMNNGLQPIVR